MPFLLHALITWTTRERAPLITARVADYLREALPKLARRYGAEVLEMGIVNDHVHVLARLPARFDVPRLAQGLKGATARVANRDGTAKKGESLYWASGYDLRAVGVHSLKAAKAYLMTQRARHPGREPRST
ncbi:MAG: IS200/IS605 family transposase [Gemmatimonadetes bacterium]|nr:IS200/IS605 family transposase [Gemmatimonadota bacterium]